MLYVQQFLSQAGIASRREAIELIKSNRVKVNGLSVKLGAKINPFKDKIKVDNKLIKPVKQKVYYLVNKPIGYTCTLKDKYATKKVVDLVPAIPKVWPVGRLDKNSHGLIILTNDGELTHQLSHPSFKHFKKYIVSLDKAVTDNLLSRLTKGVRLKEGPAKADEVKKINNHKLLIVLHQGWKRQVRRMLAVVGYQVTDLQRVAISQWKLGRLKAGQYKEITIYNNRNK